MEMAGAHNVVAKVLATDEGKAAVDRILNDAKKAVRTMIDVHRHVVATLRDALVERDELIGEEIVEVIETALERDQEAPASVEIVEPQPETAETAG